MHLKKYITLKKIKKGKLYMLLKCIQGALGRLAQIWRGGKKYTLHTLLKDLLESRIPKNFCIIARTKIHVTDTCLYVNKKNV